MSASRAFCVLCMSNDSETASNKHNTNDDNTMSFLLFIVVDVVLVALIVLAARHYCLRSHEQRRSAPGSLTPRRVREPRADKDGAISNHERPTTTTSTTASRAVVDNRGNDNTDESLGLRQRRAFGCVASIARLALGS